MVLFPKKEENDLENFLHNDELKILVETTSADILLLSKIEADLENFKEHTTKVLKINAQRTLIVGESIAKNIPGQIQCLLKKFHPFTIITFENLEYLKKKINEKGDNSWEKVGKVLMHDGIVEKEFIDSIFV